MVLQLYSCLQGTSVQRALETIQVQTGLLQRVLQSRYYCTKAHKGINTYTDVSRCILSISVS